MPSKSKGRGSKMSLAEFGGAQRGEGTLDWAQDEFAPTPPQGPATGGQPVPGMDKGKGKDWRDFGFKAGNMGGNFREEAPVMNTKIVATDMKPPFLAYVGNLPHTIEEPAVGEEFEDVIDTRLIKKERMTFAYVEFETRDALQNAILLTGKVVRGRPIKVDVASDDQRARFENDKRRAEQGGGSGRASAFEGGRDSMGQVAPEQGSGGMGRRMGSRNTSSMDVTFSRDTMGQVASPVSPMPEGGFGREAFGESKPRTPNTSGSRGGFGGGPGFRSGSKPASPSAAGAPDFTNWRDSDRMEQPDAKPAGSPTGGREGFGRRKDDKPRTPTSGGGSSWRDAPAAKQPEGGSWRDAPPAKKPAADGDAEDAGWRGGAAAKQPPAPVPTPSKQPSENPWRRGPPS